MSNVISHQPRGRSIIGPLLLITIGALFLLGNFGYLNWGFWQTIWRFWPVILVLIGVELLVSRSRPLLGAVLAIGVIAAVIAVNVFMSGGFVQPVVGATVESERIVEELGNLTSARVDLNAGAAEITLGNLPASSSNLIEADVSMGLTGGQVIKRYTGLNGIGDMSLRGEGPPRTFWGNWARNSHDIWDVKLTPDLPLTLRVTTGASSSNIDLTQLNVKDLRLDVGAGSMDVKMPNTGSTKATVKAGAASITVQIPQGMAARIHSQSGLSSISIDEERFPKRGQYYTSNDWDSATNRLDMEIDAGVASVTVY
jgi:hypothetical protein